MKEPSRHAGLAALAAATLGGCMLVAPLDDTFVPPAPSAGAGAGGQGGVSGKGGSSNGGSVSGEAGRSDETGGTTGGTGSLTAPCDSNAQCVERSGTNAPYRCNADHECVPLRSSECPLVYDIESVKADNPIYVGAFAPMPPGAPEASTVLYPFRLALNEINGVFGGLPMPNGERRPIVLVACNNCAGDTCQPEAVDTAAQHLIDDVGASSVLATLLPDDLRRVFEDHREKNVFFLSPVGATSALGSAFDDDDLVWTMLGQPKDLSIVYRDLVAELVEPYLRDVRGIGSRPIRVALLRGSDAFGIELSARVAEELVWNGLSSIDNGDNYRGFAVDSRPLDEIVNDLIALAPDLVISTAGGEVTRGESGIIWQLETKWNGFVVNVPLPFWILSPYNAGDLLDVVDLLETEMTGADAEPTERFVGVTAASSPDGDVQSLYAVNVRDTFTDADPDTGNYYDAFYFLAYATYGSRVNDPKGADIARGMRRLLSGDPYDVGVTAIADVLAALEDDAGTIELNGTLGPPVFDSAGIRVDSGALYCFQASGAAVLVQHETLRYDRATASFGGTFPCFSDFYRP